MELWNDLQGQSLSTFQQAKKTLAARWAVTYYCESGLYCALPMDCYCVYAKGMESSAMQMRLHAATLQTSLGSSFLPEPTSRCASTQTSTKHQVKLFHLKKLSLTLKAWKLSYHWYTTRNNCFKKQK